MKPMSKVILLLAALLFTLATNGLAIQEDALEKQIAGLVDNPELLQYLHKGDELEHDLAEDFWTPEQLQQIEIVKNFTGVNSEISRVVKLFTSGKYIKNVFQTLTEKAKATKGRISAFLEKKMPKFHSKLFPKKPEDHEEVSTDTRADKAGDTLPDFSRIGEIDPKCIKDKNMWYYRTWDGSCNWMGKGHTDIGSTGDNFGRDRPAHFKNGTFSVPREGPNPREVSNAFFRNNRTLHFPHTPFLTAFVEFLVHELMYGPNEKHLSYDIPVPKCDYFFDPKCTGKAKLPFWRTAADPNTGKTTPRENPNQQTIWIDGSSIYGPSEEWNKKLRTFKDGKMLLVNGYPQMNTFGLPIKSKPGLQERVFALGDWRSNQDWLLMTYHIVFLREHNRLCDILKEQHPTWDDERLFQTARVATTMKFMMIGMAYLLSYYTDMSKLSNPMTIFEQYFGQKVIPLVRYPWKRFLGPDGLPPTLPQELDLGYRWHDLVPTYMQIVDEHENTVLPVSLAETAFDAEEFMKVGIDKVIRGMGATTIPGFRSGTQEAFRNVDWNLGDPENPTGFDLVAWAIEHERERGLPTFNEYVRGYTGKVPWKPRETFDEFTSNPIYREYLKKLYKSPDDVDLAVGQELDEQLWPGTSMPRSMLIINFLTLFSMASIDRFAPTYSLARCWVDGTPFNCVTQNALDDLIWEPAFDPKIFPNGKWYSKFWLKEFDFVGQGRNLLRNMIVQNTDVECLQANPLFTVSDWNPIICSKEPRYDAPSHPNWPYNAGLF